MKRLSSFFTKPKTSSDITFSGDSGSGKEVEDFIHAVHKQAFERGKQNDSYWTAQFAATCFTGPALRWYETLSTQEQDDWKALRHALFGRYPATDFRAIIPTPAAVPPIGTFPHSVPAAPPVAVTAPPAPAPAPALNMPTPVTYPAAPSVPSVLPLPQAQPLPPGPIPTNPPPKVMALPPANKVTRQAGRIEVVVPGWPRGSAFVSRSLEKGCFKVVKANKSMALRARFLPGLGDIYLDNTDHTVHPYFGLTWSSKILDLRKSSSDSAQLTAVSPYGVATSSQSASSWRGVTWLPTWKVADDGQLTIRGTSGSFLSRGTNIEFAVYVGDDSLRLYACPSFDSFTSWVGEGYKPAKLVFTEK